MPINWFSKPRWKNKDDAIRAEAVSQQNDPDLLKILPEIARTDPAASVRAAATRRLDNIPLLLEIARNDTQPRVQKAAWNTLEKILLTAKADAIPDCADALKTIDNPSLIRMLAEKAASPEIRHLFQTRITSQGQTSELLLIETDHELRLALAKRLTKPATLQRTLKRLGKRHPQLRQILQQQLIQHDPKTRIEHQRHTALSLCEQLENLVHGHKSLNEKDIEQRRKALNHIQQSWQSLLETEKKTPGASLPPALINRFSGAFNTAELMLDPQRREAFLATQQAQRHKHLLKEATTMLENIQQRPENVHIKHAKDLQRRLQDLTTHNTEAEIRRQASTLLEQIEAWLSQQQTSSGEPGHDPVNEQAQTLLAVLHKALKSSHVHGRTLSRLRRQWDTLASEADHSDQLAAWESQFQQGMLQLAEKLEQQKKQRDQATEKALELIEKTQAAIQAGHLAEAKKLFNQHVQQKKIAGANHPLIKKNKHHIDRCWNALKELRQWQKWSNDKVRQRLIDELKATPTTGWHPDAMLAKLKDMSAQWKALEEQERLEGDRYPVRNQKMWKEFRALQDALFELAQPYFAERSDQWQKNLEEAENILRTLQNLHIDELEPRQMATHVRSAVQWLKKLETLPPAERGRIASQLRTQINRLDKPLKAHYDEARKRKQALIEQSRALQKNEDLTAAIEQAKALQKQWKTAGFVPQGQERKLWKQFRQAQDAVFARLDAEKQQAQAQQQALRNAAKAFLNDIESRAQAASTTAELKTLLSELRAGWATHDHAGLEHAFSKLENHLQARLQTARWQQQHQALSVLKQAGDICQQLETEAINPEAAQAQWHETIETALTQLGQAGNSPAWTRQRQRFEQALHSPGQTSDENQQAAYLQTLIAGEFLAGLDTPAEFQSQRQAYQVDRLARRMSGEPLPDSSQEAQNLLETLYTLANIDPTLRQAHHKRQQQLEKALLELLATMP